ncbi:MAG: hypothetical protein PHZ02_01280 [Desulfocapsaceae bacterium]|nr:hypothetical protein [Desulfocapsaceae bacterium]
MEKDIKIKELKEQLNHIDTAIRGELVKIERLKSKITKEYRHHDKKKYDDKRNEVQVNLEKLKTDQERIKNELSKLEATI